MIDKNELTNSWEIFRDKMISALTGKGKQIMPDREKVINDLQDAVNDDWLWQHADYYAETMKNAITLLKEQEAVEPIPYHRSDGTIFKYECRKCRTKIFKMDLFCRHCGQAVKWE